MGDAGGRAGNEIHRIVHHKIIQSGHTFLAKARSIGRKRVEPISLINRFAIQIFHAVARSLRTIRSVIFNSKNYESPLLKRVSLQGSAWQSEGGQSEAVNVSTMPINY